MKKWITMICLCLWSFIILNNDYGAVIVNQSDISAIYVESSKETLYVEKTHILMKSGKIIFVKEKIDKVLEAMNRN